MTMMFFLVPSSRQTRRTIWSGVSVKGLGAPPLSVSRLLVSLPALVSWLRTMVGGLGEGARGAAAAGEQAFGELAGAGVLARFEGVEIGDETLGFAKVGELVGGNDVELAIIIVRVVGKEDAQAVADGDAGGNDEEGVGEFRALRIGQLVEGLPSDEHGHDDVLAAAGGHLAGDAIQEGVGVFVGAANLVFDPGVALALRHLGEVDEGFEGFDLAEEQFLVAIGAGPILKKLGGGAGDAGKALIAEIAPLLHPSADLVDEFVLLNAILGPLGFKIELILALLLGLGNGDEIEI